MTRSDPRATALVFVTTENGCQCCISHALQQNGYTYIRHGGGPKSLHRLIYEFKCGPIPHGCDIHHECFNKHCVNTGHLKILTHSEHRRLHSLIDNREKSLPTGVTAHRSRFRARHAVRGKSISLGVYDTPEQAALALTRYQETHSASSQGTP